MSTRQQQNQPQQPRKRQENGSMEVDPRKVQAWMKSLSWEELQEACQVCEPDADFFQQMVELSVTPPIPIHPRAVPSLASKSCATDGRYSTEWEQRHRDRLQKPRLLHFVKNSSRSTPSVSRRRRHAQSHGLLQEQSQQQQQQSLSQQYTVLARGFIFPDGNRFAVPSTAEQQEMDLQLLQLLDVCTPLYSTTNAIYVRWKSRLSCARTISQLLRLLRIVSRGNFLSRCPCLASHSTATSPQQLLFPIWFVPTQRYFSLSMYVAARMETSLMQYYALHVLNGPNATRPPSHGTSTTNPTHMARVFAKHAPKIWHEAIGQVLREDQSSCLPKVRDCLTRFLLLEGGPNGFTESCGGVPCGTNNWWWTISLLHVGSARHQLQIKVQQLWKTRAARQMELELLLDEEQEQGANNTKSSPRGSNHNRNKSSNKKRGGSRNRSQRHKNNKSRGRGRTLPSNQRHFPAQPSRLGRLDEENDDEQSVSSSSSSSSTLPLLITDNNKSTNSQNRGMEGIHEKKETFEFPKNANISSRSRNRNIVLAMGVVEDLVQATFLQAGLPPAKGESAEDMVMLDQGNNVAQSKVTVLDEEGAVQGQVSSLDLNTEPNGPPKDAAEDAVSKPVVAAPLEELPQNKPFLETWGDDQNEPLQPFSSSSQAGSSQGAFDIFASPSGNLAGGFLLRPESIDFAWDTHDFAFDQWSASGHPLRQQSIMHDLFLSQERREQEVASSTIASIASSGPHDAADDEEDDPDLFTLGREDQEEGGDDQAFTVNEDEIILEPQFTNVDEGFVDPGMESVQNLPASVELPVIAALPKALETNAQSQYENDGQCLATSENAQHEELAPYEGAPSPPSLPSGSPGTPPPTLSPILVSLADLKTIQRTESADNQTINSDLQSSSSVPTGGANNNSPQGSVSSKPRLTTSLSRENLRSYHSKAERLHQRQTSLGKPIEQAAILPGRARGVPHGKYLSAKAIDDSDIRNQASIRRKSDALQSYRSLATPSYVKSRDDQDAIHSNRTPTGLSSYRTGVANRHVAAGLGTATAYPAVSDQARCAQSEIGNDDSLHISHRSLSLADEGDNKSLTKDGSTTISSAHSRPEPEDGRNIREERDTYRDLYLTLGAEVAKLKNLLASQNQNFLMEPPALGFSTIQQPMHPMMTQNGPSKYFDHPASLSHLVDTAARSQTLAAMSDAGYRGEHESMASEDDFIGVGAMMAQHHRQMSSGATAASDTSIEHNSQLNLNTSGGISLPLQNSQSAIPLSGLQSRLSVDIAHFIEGIGLHLKKQESRRAKAVERMTRLVTALWPRAQVKLYGSHVNHLSLPTSDVDFVICLPNVQKDTPAVAPGVLEGRNAINETNQKVLARKLKNESWIEQRSLKLIERTVVPVIKVSTKDTKAKMLHLDITFDAPSHHGLEALVLVEHLLNDLPMIRPLVLVLKQFLLDRGLLTGYTGGLSSYCLFLMVARYLQEQAASWNDCGALLMGFLDFYGNHFDPRTTGISVRFGQYFARPNYVMAGIPSQQPRPVLWNTKIPNSYSRNTTLADSRSGFLERGHSVRRNSFSDKGNVDGLRGATTGAKMATSTSLHIPRTGASATGDPNAANPDISNSNMQHGVSLPHPRHHFPPQQNFESTADHGMPYTFDPLFVEDPLSDGNNVGRNTFRIFQVLRAFSDAHRALVASLEWDLQSPAVDEDGSEYPLLKCLLQSEDVVFDL